jgi:hypothetical protein
VKSHLSQRAFAELENHFSIASFLVILVSILFSVGFLTVFSTGFNWGDGFTHSVRFDFTHLILSATISVLGREVQAGSLVAGRSFCDSFCAGAFGFIH